MSVSTLLELIIICDLPLIPKRHPEAVLSQINIIVMVVDKPCYVKAEYVCAINTRTVGNMAGHDV